MESFDRLQLAGLALICLKNESKADAERDVRELIFAAGADVAEKARRERLLRCDIPESSRMIPTRRSQDLTIGRKGH